MKLPAVESFFRSAGLLSPITNGARAAHEADGFLTKHGTPEKALPYFRRLARSDGEILDAVLLYYLRDRVEGEFLGRGHHRHSGSTDQSIASPAEKPNAESGSPSITSEYSTIELALPDSAPVDVAGHLIDPDIADMAASPAASSQVKAPAPLEGRSTSSPTPPSLRLKPNKPRGAEAIKAVQHVFAKSLFETYKVRDGRPIGTLNVAELKRIPLQNARENFVIQKILGHVANARDQDRVVDIISENTLRAAIEEAEVANVA